MDVKEKEYINVKKDEYKGYVIKTLVCKTDLDAAIIDCITKAMKNNPTVVAGHFFGVASGIGNLYVTLGRTDGNYPTKTELEVVHFGTRLIHVTAIYDLSSPNIEYFETQNMDVVRDLWENILKLERTGITRIWSWDEL